jgi:uncharacterized protein YuzE
VKIEFNNEAGALYVERDAGDVAHTEQVREGAFVDLDAEGRAIGAGFLSPETFEDFAKDLVDDPDLSTDILAWMRGQDDLRRLLEEAASEARRRRIRTGA